VRPGRFGVPRCAGTGDADVRKAGLAQRVDDCRVAGETEGRAVALVAVDRERLHAQFLGCGRRRKPAAEY